MKDALVVLSVLTISVLFSISANSEERTTEMVNDYGQFKGSEVSEQKDQCLIIARNCVNGDDTVLKRVERLNNEIGKGSAVYTPEELRNFQEQLNWIYYESGEFPAVRL